MTQTSALPPDHAVRDAQDRRVLKNFSGGSEAGREGKFPELLGRMAARPAGDQSSNSQAVAQGGGDAAAGTSQSQPPWKFRIGIGDALTLPEHSATSTEGAGAAVANTAASSTAETGGSNLPSATTAKQVLLDAKDMPGADPDLATQLLTDEQDDDLGVQENSADTAGALDDAQALAASDQALTDTNVLAADVDRAAAMEGPVRGAAAPPAQPTLASKGRSGGNVSAENATVTASEAGLSNPTANPAAGDASDPAAVDMSATPIEDAAKSHTQAKDQEAPPHLAGETKATVLRAETHLPPMAHALPMQQIAERLESELSVVEKPVDTASVAGSSVNTVSAVKVLHIQLQPADMGTVTVRMTLRGDELEIQLDVSRHDTARMLQQDRDALSKVLHSAGYVLDGLAVHVVEPDRTATQTQPGMQGHHAATQPSVQAQTGWSQPDGHSSGMQRQAEHGTHRPSAPSDAAGNDTARTRIASGGVYL